jgi:hypothetical protein
MEETPTLRLPKGVFFEEERQRWRVRLYKEADVMHLSYHRTLEDALETWLVAKARQKHSRRQHIIPETHTMRGLLRTLAASLHPRYILMPL